MPQILDEPEGCKPHKSPRPTVELIDFGELYAVLRQLHWNVQKNPDQLADIISSYIIPISLKFSHLTSRTQKIHYKDRRHSIVPKPDISELVALDTLQRSFNWLHRSSLTNTLSPWSRRWIKNLVKMASDLLKYVWQSEETHPGSGEQSQGPR